MYLNKMKYNYIALFSLLMINLTFGQGKMMDLSVYDDWKTIQEKGISNDGHWVVYVAKPHKGDGVITIYNTITKRQYSFERGHNFQIDFDNDYVAFMVEPSIDSTEMLRRSKADDRFFPNDTLAIFYFEEKRVEKIPHIKQYKMPSKWGGTIAYEVLPMTVDIDSIAHANLVKEENEENGTHYIVRSGQAKSDISIGYCKDLIFSERKGKLVYHSTGNDTTNLNGLYLRDIMDKGPTKIIRKKGDYSKLNISKSGRFVSFCANFDTTEAKIKPFRVMLFDSRTKALSPIIDDQSRVLKKDWLVSGDRKPIFSEDESRLFYGLRRMPFVQDTSLLDDEIVQVEVWNTKDKLLHTQQKTRLASEKTKSYLAYYDILARKNINIATETVDNIRFDVKRSGDYALGIDEKPYQEYLSWLGFTFKDLYLINLKTGKKEQIVRRMDGYPSMSPNGKYVFWYSRIAKEYRVYNIGKSKEYAITTDKTSIFHNELHDAPADPWPYGSMSWSEDDKYIYIYDRYDIWQVDPMGKKKPKRVTQGREQKKTYRYIPLDEELDFISTDTTIMVHIFQEKTKGSGYGFLNLETNKITEYIDDDFKFSMRPIKAKDSDDIIYTKENFDVFPDLIHSDLTFAQANKISGINQQQKQYAWGSIELIEWTGVDDKPMTGMLVKPANFDENEKYPMIVNFYERSSDGLHRHRSPYAHRSTINYSYYANQGYVIFNPDVPYTIGYPGQSALDAVMTGVDAVLDLGFVDKDKMGLQGHSWGGYQVAHILTKTGRFACAESGAPVVNMTSAYGGIRWRTGMSRMFQYEKTQSRLGATLWEKPELYIENSPLFNLDKVTTPVLILHNDKDGAVPWYQGIEYFVGLRRLDKTAWLLNYNDEPHWPVKRQNRIDFNTRMQQFFDHYLKGNPIPKWMHKGVPAIEKGINQGLEYLEK